MLNILFVIENKVLLKKVCTYFIDEKNFFINIVSFSSKTFEEFVKEKPDIVVIDSETLVPFSTIIKSFEKCKWDYHVIVLANSNEIAMSLGMNMHYLDKNHVEKQDIMGIISSIPKIVNISGTITTNYVQLNWSAALSSNPDYYYLFLAKYVDHSINCHSDTQIEKLKELLTQIVPVKLVSNENNDVIIFINKSKLQQRKNLSKVEKIIMDFFDKDYSILKLYEILWTNLESKCNELISLSKYSYFYVNQSVPVERLVTEIKTISMDLIDNEYANILSGLLNNKATESVNQIKEIYFRIVKSSLDLRAILYIRQKLGLLNLLTASIAKSDPKILIFTSKTIEDEYKNSAKILNDIQETLKVKTILPVNKKALLYIFNNYKKEISLEILAAELKVTKIYFSRIFKEEMGVNFLEFVQVLRIFTAQFLLINEDFAVGKISGIVGYDDAHYFSRLFKKKVGLSPEKYKILMRKDEVRNESFI